MGSEMCIRDRSKTSPLEHYDTLGYIVAVITFISIFLMYRVARLVKRRMAQQKPLVVPDEPILNEA